MILTTQGLKNQFAILDDDVGHTGSTSLMVQDIHRFRNSMTSEKLNHIMILQVHKELTGQLDLKRIAAEVISRNTLQDILNRKRTGLTEEDVVDRLRSRTYHKWTQDAGKSNNAC